MRCGIQSTQDPFEHLHETYSGYLAEHGPSAAGSGWGNQDTLDEYTEVILRVLGDDTTEQTTLLDFGCGWGGTYQYMLRHGPRVHYHGIDINPDLIAAARERFGATFICQDILQTPLVAGSYDYAIANGVFTFRGGVPVPQFSQFMFEAVEQLWRAAKVGVAWNVLSTHVDYETDDWFHVPFDVMADFLIDALGCRRFRFLNEHTAPWYYAVHAFH